MNKGHRAAGQPKIAPTAPPVSALIAYHDIMISAPADGAAVRDTELLANLTLDSI